MYNSLSIFALFITESMNSACCFDQTLLGVFLSHSTYCSMYFMLPSWFLFLASSRDFLFVFFIQTPNIFISAPSIFAYFLSFSLFIFTSVGLFNDKKSVSSFGNFISALGNMLFLKILIAMPFFRNSR